MDIPAISVIMPVYNGLPYLKDAIKSILNQSFTNFEFIIINDGSSDSSINTIESYADIRIKSVNLKKNVGNYPARNLGFELAKGKYLCVMDCDDISLPNRLYTQYHFLERNQKIAACATPASIIGTEKIWREPMDYEDLKIAFIEDNYCVHPSLMIRTNIIKKFGLMYNEQFKYASDYDLISNIMNHAPVKIIKDVLLEYRIHKSQISSKHSIDQQNFADLIRLKQLAKFDISPTNNERNVHLNLLKGRLKGSNIKFGDLINWADYLIAKNNIVGYYNSSKLINFLRGKLKQSKIIMDRELV